MAGLSDGNFNLWNVQYDRARPPSHPERITHLRNENYKKWDMVFYSKKRVNALSIIFTGSGGAAFEELFLLVYVLQTAIYQSTIDFKLVYSSN